MTTWDNWIFRHTCCINNSHWQSSGIIIFLCKCCIVISDTLLSSFLDVFFLLFAAILLGLHEKPRRNKDWVTEKKYIEKFVWRTCLTARPPFYVTFVAFFIYSFPLPKWRTCWVAPIKMHNIAMGDILCDDLSERSKIWKYLAI